MGILAEWGYPEPGDLGPRESPAIIGRAVAMLAPRGISLDDLAARAAMPPELLSTVVMAGAEPELSSPAG